MYRCAALLLSIAAFTAPAGAQLQRNFPPTALRGTIVIADPPDILLNGRRARLAPGARIRGKSNMIELTGGLVGARMLVNYTVEINGFVQDVWILRPEEADVRPWPTTPEQAASWIFDPAAQTWSKP